MKRYDIDGGIPTLAVALSEHMNTEALKKLASLMENREDFGTLGTTSDATD